MRYGTPDLPTDQMLKLPSPITRVGGLLRKTSLDELPQLFNVVNGKMSLVGPRPALYNQTELTAMRQEAGVLRFLPGITGWAQINGRDELPDDVKVAADKWYCDNWNYWLDWRIIFSTFGTVLSKRGAF
jgi:O-antigen biosynthesis protein WbqP